MSWISKYFENALDHESIDHERKMVIEGHFAGTGPDITLTEI